MISQPAEVARAPSGIDQIGSLVSGAPVPGTEAANTQANAPSPGAAVSPARSVEEAIMRANLGDARAMSALGIAFSDGNGVAQDSNEALMWLRRAAQLGEPVAEYRLAVRLERGIGVAKDPVEAAHWYAEAAQQGNGRAMYNLGVAYANGQGVDKNPTEAIRWFQSAAELGLTDAQFNLAVMYERGMGVGASLSEAYKWYAIAQVGGDTESKARVEALTTQMPAAQKDAADQAVRSFKPKPMNAVANEVPQLTGIAKP
jgi:localization factor PodJL